jgi:hypothetical protein
MPGKQPLNIIEDVTQIVFRGFLRLEFWAHPKKNRRKMAEGVGFEPFLPTFDQDHKV